MSNKSNNKVKRRAEATDDAHADEAAVPAAKKAKKAKVKGVPKGPSNTSDGQPAVPNPRKRKRDDEPRQSRNIGRRLAKVPALEVLDVFHFKGRYSTFRPDSAYALVNRAVAKLRKKQAQQAAKRRGTDGTQGEEGATTSGAQTRKGEDTVVVSKAVFESLMSRLSALEIGRPAVSGPSTSSEVAVEQVTAPSVAEAAHP